MDEGYELDTDMIDDTVLALLSLTTVEPQGSVLNLRLTTFGGLPQTVFEILWGFTQSLSRFRFPSALVGCRGVGWRRHSARG